MNKPLIVLFLGLVLLLPSATHAQDPAPTLVPPTLVPTAPADVVQLADYSGVATAQNEGALRVGARYNMPPFSYLDSSGSLAGYEVDVMNAIAIELGISINWVQVTAENELEELQTGRVDALIGEQVHTRDAEQVLGFSHPYYLNQQRMVVLESAPYASFADLNGQAVSVVTGSYGEDAIQALLDAGLGYQVRGFFTEKEALDALERGEVAAMVGEYDDLNRAGRLGMRYIEQPVRLDPYAVALRRYDVNLRNAINRSIQRLWASGRLKGIYESWFSDPLDFDVLLPVYENVFDDTRTINDFPTDMPRPAESLLNKVLNGQTLNVAGVSLNTAGDPLEWMLDPFNQALINEMARRWGVGVNLIPNSGGVNSVEFLGRGEADLVVGVTPRWDGADRFDYSRPYAVHGDRLLVLEGSRYKGFGDFRGGSYMGFWYEDADDRQRIEDISAALRVNAGVYEFRSIDEITEKILNRNVHGVFGDSLRLRWIIELTRTSGIPWVWVEQEVYSRVPITLALPRNDADFMALVDWTLQDMFLDGTYQRIYTETFGDGEPLVMLTWAGDGSWLLGR